jgi:ferredoxin
MIVANRKKIPEIAQMLKEHKKVLMVGCGTCVTVCLAGGEREVGIMASAARISLRLAGKTDIVIDECTIERQCEDAFIDILADRVREYDAVCSFACGAGVQRLAERFAKVPVYPGLNTQFIGILESQGVWTEKCIGCGSCRLAEFSGVCAITRCAKSRFNGPCGGSREGKCEIDNEIDCAWQLIYDRAGRIGTIEKLKEIASAQDWSKARDGGPRKVVREDQRIEGMAVTSSTKKPK